MVTFEKSKLRRSMAEYGNGTLTLKKDIDNFRSLYCFFLFSICLCLYECVLILCGIFLIIRNWRHGVYICFQFYWQHFLFFVFILFSLVCSYLRSFCRIWFICIYNRCICFFDVSFGLFFSTVFHARDEFLFCWLLCYQISSWCVPMSDNDNDDDVDVSQSVHSYSIFFLHLKHFFRVVSLRFESL